MVTTSFENVLIGTLLARASPATMGDMNTCMQRTKVGQLELAGGVDEQVLRLEVAVQHFARMAVVQAAQQLEEEELHVAHVNQPAVVHVCFQVPLLPQVGRK